MNIFIKRIYDDYSKQDGFRILVDRLWPRGISKETAHIDLWLKEVAPTDELRKWFAHDPAKWDEFRRRYITELKDKANSIGILKKQIKDGKVTLLYGAKDKQHNQAVVLREYLEKS